MNLKQTTAMIHRPVSYTHLDVYKRQQQLFADSADIKMKEMRLGKGKKRRCFLAYIEVAVSNMLLETTALGRLLALSLIHILGTAMPSFVLATLLLLVFCLKLGWIPVWSSSNPNYLLPIIALAAYPMAYITRLTKTSMLDALNQDYIRTARAKGVHRLKVIFKHALKNALIPVVTYVGPMVAYILTGSMVVENIFTIGGLGTEFVTSIVNRDYTMIMAITIFLAVLMVVANLLTDIAYKLIDPRITFE